VTGCLASDLVQDDIMSTNAVNEASPNHAAVPEWLFVPTNVAVPSSTINVAAALRHKELAVSGARLHSMSMVVDMLKAKAAKRPVAESPIPVHLFTTGTVLALLTLAQLRTQTMNAINDMSAMMM